MRQSSYWWPALAIVLGVFVHIAFPQPKTVSGQEPIPTPRAVPTPNSPEVLDGGFIPADVLLQQADARHPPTAEGWIVRVPPARSLVEIDPGNPANDNFDYLLRLRQYDSQIRIAQAEVDSWRRRLSVYRYFNKTGALFVTHENAMLSLISTEEQLRNLRYERMLFVRQHQLRPRYPVVEPVVEEKVIGPSY